MLDPKGKVQSADVLGVNRLKRGHSRRHALLALRVLRGARLELRRCRFHENAHPAVPVDQQAHVSRCSATEAHVFFPSNAADFARGAGNDAELGVVGPPALDNLKRVLMAAYEQ